VTDVHIRQYIESTDDDDDDDISMVTGFHSAAPRDFVERAIEEVATLGILAKPHRYDKEVNTFFVNVKPSDLRGEYCVKTAATLIKQRIKTIVEAASSQQPPNHHGDREADADVVALSDKPAGGDV